jgi:hypothetical protein
MRCFGISYDGEYWGRIEGKLQFEGGVSEGGCGC